MSVRLCVQPGRGGFCLGRLEWRHEGGHWRSRCPRCEATGRAASGEAAQLDAELNESQRITTETA